MSWSDFPHTVTVETTLEEDAGDGILGDAERSGGTSVAVCVTTNPRNIDFASYGISLGGGAVLRCQISDAATFTPSARVTFQGVAYTVLSAPALHPDDVLGYAEVILGRDGQ